MNNQRKDVMNETHIRSQSFNNMPKFTNVFAKSYQRSAVRRFSKLTPCFEENINPEKTIVNNQLIIESPVLRKFSRI